MIDGGGGGLVRVVSQPASQPRPSRDTHTHTHNHAVSPSTSASLPLLSTDVYVHIVCMNTHKN